MIHRLGGGSWILALRSCTAEATSGITLLSGMAGAASMLVMTYLGNYYLLLPGGGNTLNLPLALCYLIGPLLGGLAAVRAGRLRTQGVLALAATTPRGRRAVMMIVAAAFVGWGLLAYMCGAVVVGSVVGVNGPWTARMALLAGDAIVLISLLVVVGLVIGCRISNVLVGPGFAIIAMLCLTVLDFVPDPIGRFSPIFPGKIYPYGYEPNGALLTGVIVVMMGFIIVLFGQGFYSPTGRRVVPGVVALVFMVAGAFTVLSASSEPVVRRTGGTGDCRSSQGIELCVWPGPGVDIHRDLAILVKVRIVASRFFPVPTAFHEEGLHPTRSPSLVISDAPTVVHESYLIIAGKAMLPQPCSEATDRDQSEILGLFGKLINGEVKMSDPYSAGAALADGSIARQRAWIAPRLKALRDCG